MEYGVPEYFNDKCFHCIDDGYMFCSADGISGTCIDVTCQEYSLNQEEKDEAKAAGKCTVVPADKTKSMKDLCPVESPSTNVRRTAFS